MNYNTNVKIKDLINSFSPITFDKGFCNGLGYKILSIKFPHSNIAKQIINEFKQCYNVFSLRKIIKKYGKFQNILLSYGYKPIETNKIIAGDFLLKDRTNLIQDIIYCYDGINYISTNVRKKNILFSDKIFISNKHKIWRVL